MYIHTSDIQFLRPHLLSLLSPLFVKFTSSASLLLAALLFCPYQVVNIQPLKTQRPYNLLTVPVPRSA